MKEKLKNIWLLMSTFFKVGLFTFGGGLAMLPIIEREVVDKHKWLSHDEMTDLIVIAESTPGAIAVNTATFIGYKVGKLWGAILATLSLVCPSVIIITIISFFVEEFLALELDYVTYAFNGIRCAVGVLILFAAIKIFKGNQKYWYTYVLLAIAVVIMLCFPNISTIYIIIGGGIIGLLINLLAFKNQNKKKVEGDIND